MIVNIGEIFWTKLIIFKVCLQSIVPVTPLFLVGQCCALLICAMEVGVVLCETSGFPARCLGLHACLLMGNNHSLLVIYQSGVLEMRVRGSVCSKESFVILVILFWKILKTLQFHCDVQLSCS